MLGLGLSARVQSLHFMVDQVQLWSASRCFWKTPQRMSARVVGAPDFFSQNFSQGFWCDGFFPACLLACVGVDLGHAEPVAGHVVCGGCRGLGEGSAAEVTAEQ